MVTCFRPRSPHVKDETVLTGVRGISYKSEMYTQYMEYRLDNLEERVRAKQRAERRREQGKRPFDVAGAREWLEEQRDYIDAMLQEITEE